MPKVRWSQTRAGAGARRTRSSMRRSSAFSARSTQVPPMYSALKRDGQPLYKLARAGVTVERAARAIEIFELAPARLRGASARARGAVLEGHLHPGARRGHRRALWVRCGHVTALRRLYVEPFEGEPMHTLEALDARSRRRDAAGTAAARTGRSQQLPAVHLTAAQTAACCTARTSRALRRSAQPRHRRRARAPLRRGRDDSSASARRDGTGAVRAAPALQWHRSRLKPTGRTP